MKVIGAILVLLGAISPVVQAQDAWNLDEVPKCAHDCLAKGIVESGCANPSDLACLCLSEKYRQTATACVKAKCSNGDAYVFTQSAPSPGISTMLTRRFSTASRPVTGRGSSARSRAPDDMAVFPA